jgi:pimeloyl-ACP methyl ester carboxylesterase
MHRFFRNAFFDFEIVRILGMTPNGGADVAEVLQAVGEIRDGDQHSWERAWKAQAESAEALAEEARLAGHVAAAHRAYLRAANYTRASGYMLTGCGPGSPDPRSRPICDEVALLFGKAAALLDTCTLHPVDIPYEGNKTLRGYLYIPRADYRASTQRNGRVPVLINLGGADSLQEELFFVNPSAGPELGYAVLTFDGPGQGLTLHGQGVKMRPDWEVVIGHVLDFLEALSYGSAEPGSCLDVNRVCLSGATLGGYLALRASADERIKATVAIDPFFSMWDFATSRVSPLFLSAWDEWGWLSDGFVNSCFALMMKCSFRMFWEICTISLLFGLSSPALILREMKRYSLGPGHHSDSGKGSDNESSGGYLEKVKCPVLVSGASKSFYFEPRDHAVRIYEGLTNVGDKDKELWISTNPGQGSLQAKMGAIQLCNQRSFAFLDTKLNITRTIPTLLGLDRKRQTDGGAGRDQFQTTAS